VGLKSRINVLETLFFGIDERRSSTRDLTQERRGGRVKDRKIDNIQPFL
jgi:hypothetical protein